MLSMKVFLDWTQFEFDALTMLIDDLVEVVHPPLLITEHQSRQRIYFRRFML